MDVALKQPNKVKKDSLGEAVGMIANAFQEFVNSKKKWKRNHQSLKYMKLSPRYFD
ncbi:hypothetical protein ACJIZ3_019549 [Penstemon smallii]|uniref:Uncharacterized protein n=1 Tax=Penstemon smallii TaxID=265156 RepID=A0ABD3T1G4_9LAMI